MTVVVSKEVLRKFVEKQKLGNVSQRVPARKDRTKVPKHKRFRNVPAPTEKDLEAFVEVVKAQPPVTIQPSPQLKKDLVRAKLMTGAELTTLYHSQGKARPVRIEK